MRLVRIPDPRLFAQVKTYLDADYISGTALTVLNNIGFLTNQFTVVGEVGEKLSEIQNVLSLTSSNQVNIQTGYNFFHSKGTTLYLSVWNLVSIEGMPASGNWSVINDNGQGGQVIDWTANDTLFYHTSGDDTWSYRFRFKNTITGLYSEYSPTIPGSGFTAFQVGQMIINLRKKIRDPNRQRFQDADLILQLQQIQRDIEMIFPKLWFLRVDTFENSPQNGMVAVAGQYKYSLANYTDLNYIHKIRYQYQNGINNIVFDLTPMSDIEYDRITANQNRLQDDNVRKVRLLPPDSNSPQGYFETFPTPLGAVPGNFYPVYYRKLKNLLAVTDTTDLPFPEILEDGAAWRFHQYMGNEEQAKIYGGLYLGPKQDDKSKPMTGLAMLQQYNSSRLRQQAYGQNLVKYRGPRGRNNFFGSGIYTRDYIREFYM